MSDIIKISANVLVRSRCILGESPIWDSEKNSCFWVDIEKKEIFRYTFTDRSINRYSIQHKVSFIRPIGKDDVLVGLQGGVGQYSLSTGKLTMISDLGLNAEEYRCNDGGCDSFGRLWIGTMGLNHQDNRGSVYCIDNSGKYSRKITKLTIPNGLVWLNEHSMIHTDSVSNEVVMYSYDYQTDTVKLDRTVISIPEKAGMPDGMAIDREGMVWVALWGGYGVGRFDIQSGRMVAFVSIPVPHVTSCCFGGENNDQLIITTARRDLSDEDLIRYPNSGNVFVASTGVKGKNEYSWISHNHQG